MISSKIPLTKSSYPRGSFGCINPLRLEVLGERDVGKGCEVGRRLIEVMRAMRTYNSHSAPPHDTDDSQAQS